MNRLSLAALTAILLASTSAYAQYEARGPGERPRADVRGDAKEIHGDRKELRDDMKERREDRKDLREDAKERHEDRKDAREELRGKREERRQMLKDENRPPPPREGEGHRPPPAGQ